MQNEYFKYSVDHDTDEHNISFMINVEGMKLLLFIVYTLEIPLRKGRRDISLPILGCGGPGHVAAKHLSISSVSIEEFLEEGEECKNVTRSPDQKDLVNLVLEKMSDEIKQKNTLDQLEVRKICSRPEVKRRTPTTSNEQETKTSTYESPTSGKTDPSKLSNGYCQVIFLISIETLASHFMITRLLP